jgi:hypothetical protein
MMKSYLTSLFLGISVACPALISAEEVNPDVTEALQRHEEGSTKLADEQDELSADVQQLAIEQTVPKVIELLTEVEDIMDEATDWLADYDTGGKTIAAQTEIIEKIYEASKERQQQQGAGQSGSAMMDMMERMMGKQPGQGPQQGQQGDGEGEGGDQGGKGATGDSNSGNEAIDGAGGAPGGRRVMEMNLGSAGRSLPEEFRKALDAYNRGVEQQLKR